MSNKEIMAVEGNRQNDATWNLVHLFKEGTFYRIYDWSAWIFMNFPVGANAEKPLNITKSVKGDSTVVFVGFPVSSQSKYIPDGLSFEAVSDTQIDIRIPLPEDFFNESYESLLQKKAAWINGTPVSESKRQKREDNAVTVQSPKSFGLLSVFGNLLALDMGAISPNDALGILRDLRKQVSVLLQ